MWDEFHECMHKIKYITHVLCKHCSKSYAHPGSIGKDENNSTTSSMSQQLINYTSFKRKKNKAKASDFTADMEVGQTTLDNYDNDSMVNKILKFFISGNIIFN